MLHPEDAGEASLMNVPEHVGKVDLAGRGLVPPRIVTDLEVGDLVPRAIDVRDEVALGDLLVIEIVEDLHRGAADGPAAWHVPIIDNTSGRIKGRG